MQERVSECCGCPEMPRKVASESHTDTPSSCCLGANTCVRKSSAHFSPVSESQEPVSMTMPNRSRVAFMTADLSSE
eukprot:15471721-Alexandrium_andersonii.AAC.1